MKVLGKYKNPSGEIIEVELELSNKEIDKFKRIFNENGSGQFYCFRNPNNQALEIFDSKHWADYHADQFGSTDINTFIITPQHFESVSTEEETEEEVKGEETKTSTKKTTK